MDKDNGFLAQTSEFILRYSAILFALLLPFFVVPQDWLAVPQSKVLFASAAIIIGLIAWLVSNVARKQVVFSLDPIVIAVLSIPLVYAVSAYVTHAPFSSFVTGDASTGTVASMFLLLGATFLGLVSVSNRRQIFPILLVTVVASAVVIVFQLLRVWFPSILSLNGVMVGSTSSVVGSWHDLAIYSVFTVLTAYGLVDAGIFKRKIISSFLHITALLAIVLLIVLNFVDAWYALAAAACIFAVVKIAKNFLRQDGIVASVRSAILWLVIAVFSLVPALFGSAIYSRLPSAMQISQSEVRPSLEGTFIAGRSLYDSGSSLVFGTGPNTFDRQWALFKPKEVNATNFWNTEFEYGYGVIPTVFVTVGVAGTIVWGLLILALLWAGFRALREETDSRLRVLLFVASALLLVYHVIYVPLIEISLLMFFLLGLLAGLNSHSWYVRSLNFSPVSMAGFVVVLVFTCTAIGGALFEMRSTVANSMVTRASSQYQKSGNIAEAAKLVQQAAQIDPQNDFVQRAAVQVGLLQFGEIAKSTSVDQATRDSLQKTLSETITHGLAAVSIDNTSYQNWLALAGLYQSLAGVGIQGAYEQAISAWQKAASTTPSSPLPLIQLGQLSMAQSKNPEAKAYFANAIALKPDLALPYYLRAQILAGETRYQEAVQDAAAAAQLADQDPLAWYALGVILYRAGDMNNAAVALERAVSLQNNYSDAIFALGVIYDSLGKHDQAIAALEKVSELNPGTPAVEQILANVRAGKAALSANSGQQSGATAGTSGQR